jgi:hypothetical protein
VRLLSAITVLLVSSNNTVIAQQLDRPAIGLGDAVVSGFSGVIAPDPAGPRPAGKSAVDLTFINPDGPSARVIGIGRPGYVWDGRLFQAPKPFDVFAKDTGQVYGVALDDAAAPNIYLAATSAFGLNLVGRGADGRPERRKVGGPGAVWMKGQFGLDLQGDPGSIYKVDGTTGVVTLFAKVMLDGVPNPGPALGNLAYDAAHRQLFVSDLYTGMIHRFAVADGSEPGAPYDHGVTGRGAANLPPIPFNPANRPNISNNRFNTENPDTWGYAPSERRVWGLAVYQGRLFYSERNGSATEAPQIWSVAIAQDGSFGADARLEVDVAAQPGPYPVSDIAFSQAGAMILAQRAPVAASYNYSAFTKSGEPRVLRYWLKDSRDPPSPGLWTPMPEEYAIGFAGTYRNTDGGVALGYGYGQDGTLSGTACEAALWTTGQNLRNKPALRSRLEPGGPLVVNGLQGSPANMVRGANEPPFVSYFIDYDDKFDDANASGHIGGVRILALPCASPVVDSGRPAATSAPPGTTTPIACVGPDCRNACTPTCICPPGTVLKGRECVKERVCPPGMVLQNGECKRVETFLRCPPPLIQNGSGTACVCPSGQVLVNGACVTQTTSCVPPMVQVPGGPCACPSGTVQQGRNCVPQICPSPLVPGPCECPIGTVLEDGLCVPPPKCPPPQVMNAAGVCVCPPPMVSGATPGSCVCPRGTVLDGDKCVKYCPPPQILNVDGFCACPPPMMSGPTPGSCLCPNVSAPQGGTCVTPPICPVPQVPNVDGICACPPPMMPGAIPGSCACPVGSEMVNGKCVTKETRCPPPLIMNADGNCVKPRDPPKREKPKREKRKSEPDQEPQRQQHVIEPERLPGMVIPGLGGGGFGGGPRGGGGGESPGRR